MSARDQTTDLQDLEAAACFLASHEELGSAANVRTAIDEIERLRSALAAIADGEGDAQEIARQTLAGETS